MRKSGEILIIVLSLEMNVLPVGSCLYYSYKALT